MKLQRRSMGCSIFFGGAIGYLSDMTIGVIFEIVWLPRLRIPGEPVLSYGLPAFVFALCCGVLGGTMGAAIVAWLRGRRLISAIVLMVPSLAVWNFTKNAWADTVARYGYDPSDYVVFVPCYIAAVTGCVLAAVAFVLAAGQKVLSHRS